MTGSIYLVENKLNGKKYVGMTQYSVKTRWKRHITDSENKRTEKRPLHDAIRKYGAENFEVSTIERCDEEVIKERESYWINKLGTYKDGYNATLGGDGRTFYDWNNIEKAYDETRGLAQAAEKLGCTSETVRNVLAAIGKDRDKNTERSLQSGIPVIATEQDGTKHVFSSQLKAANWLREIGKTDITDLRKVSCKIGKATRTTSGIVYGIKWKRISRLEYVEQL